MLIYQMCVKLKQVRELVGIRSKLAFTFCLCICSKKNNGKVTAKISLL